MRVVRPASSPSWISALLLGSTLLLGATLPAQVEPDEPQSKPTSLPVIKSTSQPAKAELAPEEAPREPTPQERLAGLHATLEKLKAEKARLEKIDETGGLGKRVLARL